LASSNSRNLAKVAKALRHCSTEAESALWAHLRNRRFHGFKFRRQQLLGSYIVDFVCFEIKLVIELDGGQHAIEKAKDQQRDTWLRGQGFQVLRFWNNEVLGNMNGVLDIIQRTLAEPPPPAPPARGGENGKLPTAGEEEKRNLLPTRG
jgi:very-short-patch-repair endonuclease